MSDAYPAQLTIKQGMLIAEVHCRCRPESSGLLQSVGRAVHAHGVAMEAAGAQDILTVGGGVRGGA